MDVLLGFLWNTVFVLTISVGTMPSLVNIPSEKQLTVENINKNIIRINSVFVGPIYEKLLELKKDLEEGVEKPFKEIIEANVGNASAGGQKPVTFIRQVTGLACLPELLECSSFPDDVKRRVKSFLQNCKGNSIGSLTDTVGLEEVRRHIAHFIQHRDNCSADWRDIIIVPGISAAAKILVRLINMASRSMPAGTMIPIPQFHLLTGSLSELGIKMVDYYLDETNQWSINVNELKRALSRGRRHSCPRAIVVVNPGNPTGQVLTREIMEEIIKFAHKENLFIVACEVYQDNVYDNLVFNSFKKVVAEMKAPYNETELVSLMSCSKGYAGESGLRGGFMEFFNFCPEVRESLMKSILISDSPPICAQIALDCVANPPRSVDHSYLLYSRERASALTEAAARATMMYEGINSITGLSCYPVRAGFTALVKVEIPKKAVEKALFLDICPSTFYGLEMLEKSGIVVIPDGSFGPRNGRYYFRITILLEEDTLKEVLQRIRKFHLGFLEEFL